MFHRSGARRLAGLLACALALASSKVASAQGGIELASVADVFSGVASAQTITLAAYSLAPNSHIVRALVAAADRGARVSVALSSSTFGSASTQNEETTQLLTAHNVTVHQSSGRSHIKIAALNGVLYLSDRNFASSKSQEIVVRDTFSGDRTIIERSLLGEAGANDHLWTRKGDALSAESAMIAVRATHTLIVSTESFNANTPVFTAILNRRRMNDSVRLLVAQSEYRTSRPDQEAVAKLVAAGVEVRISTANEKYAVDGANLWIGSANQTGGYPDQIDFGLAVTDAPLANKLRAQFADEWDHAQTPGNAR